MNPAVADLVAGRHGDPHQLLGVHGPIVRAWVPGPAANVSVRFGEHDAQARLVHQAGLWEAAAPAVAVDYRLVIGWEDGTTEVREDPYRFWPTVGELDLHLLGEGRHEALWRVLGAHIRVHQGVEGTSFAVWAPNARAVRVVGDWNAWDGRVNPMRRLGSSGVWELFVPAASVGHCYKYELVDARGALMLRADPYAEEAEVPPSTASRITQSTYVWRDEPWLAQRAATDPLHQPMSIYEVHLGSWRPGLGYRDAARELGDYVVDMGFTHVEFMPLAAHPFAGSWGYQVTSYFAPSPRFGSPDDLRYLIDELHQRGIGVIVDWVPAHFPKDEWALAHFDGTALYEHADPRQGQHPDWGTLVFNFGRSEVANFLVASAQAWIEDFHVDGLRVDAVASMLYLDYSREEWVPNRFGGRENLDAIALLRRVNEIVHGRYPGAVTMAEESTAWPAVSRPVYVGGLGFTFKWNMGWMHDTLRYFSHDPVHRRYHHNDLTFGLLYAFSENFILPLSHDEVVHGKGSLLNKMPGDRWQQMANLRALLAWMWAHPGRQLLFMGGEIAQEREWSAERGIDFDLLRWDQHEGVQRLVRTLNVLLQRYPALWEVDFAPAGFRWIEANDTDQDVIAFERVDAAGTERLLCVANLSPVVRHGYRLGVDRDGEWEEVLVTDAPVFGGSGVVNGVAVATKGTLELTLAPLAVHWLVPHG